MRTAVNAKSGQPSKMTSQERVGLRALGARQAKKQASTPAAKAHAYAAKQNADLETSLTKIGKGLEEGKNVGSAFITPAKKKAHARY